MVLKCSNFILLQVVDQCSQHHLLKRLSFLHCIFLPIVKDKMSIGAWIYLWAFYFVPLIYISVFVPVPTVLMTVALQQILKSGRLIPPVPFFFLKIALAIRGFLYFHTNYEIICSSSVKNAVGSLIGIALNLQIALSSILIFTILILLIHEHGIFLHLLVSYFISFTSVLYFYIYRSLVSLGRYIPKYFLFIVMVNGIVSLISLPGQYHR